MLDKNRKFTLMFSLILLASMAQHAQAYLCFCSGPGTSEKCQSDGGAVLITHYYQCGCSENEPDPEAACLDIGCPPPYYYYTTVSDTCQLDAECERCTAVAWDDEGWPTSYACESRCDTDNCQVCNGAGGCVTKCDAVHGNPCTVCDGEGSCVPKCVGERGNPCTICGSDLSDEYWARLGSPGPDNCYDRCVPEEGNYCKQCNRETDTCVDQCVPEYGRWCSECGVNLLDSIPDEEQGLWDIRADSCYNTCQRAFGNYCTVCGNDRRDLFFIEGDWDTCHSTCGAPVSNDNCPNGKKLECAHDVKDISTIQYVVWNTCVDECRLCETCETSGLGEQCVHDYGPDGMGNGYDECCEKDTTVCFVNCYSCDEDPDTGCKVIDPDCMDDDNTPVCNPPCGAGERCTCTGRKDEPQTYCMCVTGDCDEDVANNLGLCSGQGIPCNCTIGACGNNIWDCCSFTPEEDFDDDFELDDVDTPSHDSEEGDGDGDGDGGGGGDDVGETPGDSSEDTPIYPPIPTPDAPVTPDLGADLPLPDVDGPAEPEDGVLDLTDQQDSGDVSDLADFDLDLTEQEDSAGDVYPDESEWQTPDLGFDGLPDYSEFEEDSDYDLEPDLTPMPPACSAPCYCTTYAECQAAGNELGSGECAPPQPAPHASALKQITGMLVNLPGKKEGLPALTGRAVISSNTLSGCGEIISSPGLYVLESDVLNSSTSTCIRINSADVTVDCQSHLLDGTDRSLSYGFYVNGDAYDNVEIRNCRLSDWEYGVYVYQADYNRITENIIESSKYGIRIKYCDGCSIEGNLVSKTTYAIQLDYGQGNQVLENSIVDNAYVDYYDEPTSAFPSYGLYLYNSNNNEFRDNVIEDNWYDGIYLRQSSQNTFSGNIIQGNVNRGLYTYYNPTQGNLFYDNVFNQSQNFYFASGTGENKWNTSTECSADPNIVGGPCIGGNYWAKPDGTGFSQTCIGGGSFCEGQYELNALNIDYAPLRMYVLTTSTSTSTSTTSTTLINPADIVCCCPIPPPETLPKDTCHNYTFHSSYGVYGNMSSQFDSPSGLSASPSGMLYVADYGNNRIQKFTLDGSWIADVTYPEFASPSSVSFRENGNYFVSGLIDIGSGHLEEVLLEFDPNDSFIRLVMDLENPPNQVKDSASAGNTLYVTSYGTGEVFVYEYEADNWLYSRKWDVSTGGDTYGALAWGVGVDSEGIIYVSDTANHKIKKFTTEGLFTGSFGGLGSGPGFFNMPFDVSIDRSDHVYVADSGNDRVQKFYKNGTFITSFGASGSGDGEFTSPGYVYEDGLGNAYVSDTGNDRIQKWTCNHSLCTPYDVLLDVANDSFPPWEWGLSNTSTIKERIWDEPGNVTAKINNVLKRGCVSAACMDCKIEEDTCLIPLSFKTMEPAGQYLIKVGGNLSVDEINFSYHVSSTIYQVPYANRFRFSEGGNWTIRYDAGGGLILTKSYLVPPDCDINCDQQIYSHNNPPAGLAAHDAIDDAMYRLLDEKLDVNPKDGVIEMLDVNHDGTADTYFDANHMWFEAADELGIQALWGPEAAKLVVWMG
ncbi:MAG: NosD domain-containing protein [Candidatus Altiarchaeota archaeon]